MSKVLNGLATLALIGLVVAILRAFDWDIIAAADWLLSWFWDTITKVADIWSNNDSFKEATKKPK